MSQKGGIMSLTKTQQRNLVIGLLIVVFVLYAGFSVISWSQHRQDIAAQISTRQAITEATLQSR
jgi:hypothetical protein